MELDGLVERGKGVFGREVGLFEKLFVSELFFFFFGFFVGFIFILFFT